MWSVSSDQDDLKAVLVHRPGQECAFNVSLDMGHPAALEEIIDLDEADAEFSRFISLLRTHTDAEIFFLSRCLKEAVASMTESEKSQVTNELIERENLQQNIELNHKYLLGSERTAFFNKDTDGSFKPLVRPKIYSVFTRDMGAMTGKGMIICNSWDPLRQNEGYLLKTVLKYHPVLRDKIKVLYDATSDPEGFLEGGDIIVLNEDTILMGLGNLSNEAAAKNIAKTGLKVIGVRMPFSDGWKVGNANWTKFHRRFLHLDSLFNLVDDKVCLAFPYFFDESISVLINFLKGLAKDMKNDNIQSQYPVEEIIEQADALGMVTEYYPDGRIINTNLRLLDYLKPLGLDIVYVGGDSTDYLNEFEHLVHALRSLRFQAGNVLALKPGTVISYDRDPKTLLALRSKGVKVLTFSSRELMSWNGGPHCLSLPLLRHKGHNIKPALIIVDVQNDFKKGMSPYECPQLDEDLLARIKELKDFCRSKNIPVIYTLHSIKPDKSDAEIDEPDSIRACIIGTPGWGIAPELEPSKNDHYVQKKRFDAFYGSDLENIIKELGVNTAVICGVWTNNCVRATAEGAYYRDLRLILVSDCCGAVDFVNKKDHEKVNIYTLNELQERTYGTKLVTLGEFRELFE